MPRALLIALALASARTATAAPDDLVSRPLVLPERSFAFYLTAEIDLTPGSFAAPLSFAPELWIGATPRLTIGLIHGNRSVDQIDTGGAVCVRDCDRTYEGGLDGRYALRGGPLSIAARGRALLRDTDPLKPAVTLGALVRYQRGRFAVTTDPYLRLGLANTDRGNRAALVLPLWLAIQPTCRWLIALHTGWNSDLAVIRDGWHVPFGLIVGGRPTPSIDVLVEAGFTSPLGPQNQLKQRALLVTVGWLR